MMERPFHLFASFEDRLRIALFTKEDAVACDADAAHKLGLRRFVSLDQAHGNTTAVVENETHRTLRADGMLTSSIGLVLMIRAADCQNFIVYDPSRHIAGLLHLGWRGLVAGAIPLFFKTLRAQFGTAPEDVYVGSGPSLCQRCAVFSDPQKELMGVEFRFVDDHHADLRGIAKNSLLSLGVRPACIEEHPDCTCCAPQHYWTYRGGDEKNVKEGKVNRLCCILTK